MEGMNLSVCVFVCPDKTLHNFWWNEEILMKFSGPVKLCADNFYAGVLDQLTSRVQPWLKKTCSYILFLLHELLSNKDRYTFLETLELGREKIGS
jgi:hypothetical protein